VKTNGTPLWAEFHGFDQGSNGYGPVADLDNDGLPEVVVPVLDGKLVCLDGKTGKRRWTVPAPVTGDVIAVDVDGNGEKDLVFGGTDGQMWAVRGSDGAKIWTINAPGNPIAADVDADGTIELLAVGPEGVLRVVGHHSGSKER
jgi:outer membrane protein assembly factor BamB